MKNIIKKLLAKPVKVINNMVLELYLHLVKGKAKGIKKIEFEGKKLLILSPHQDDEMLGCGCLIKKTLEAGGLVKCIYITDGSKSLSDQLTPEAMIEIRKAEAIRLTEHLNMEEPIFLGCSDGSLEPDDKEAADKVAQAIEDYKPDAVLIPYFLDGHKDHTAVSGIYLASMKKLKNHKEFDTYCYEINSPISVHGITHYMDCSGYLKAKSDALDFYSSQTMSFESIFAMNRLNRILTGVEEGAELFRIVELESYEIAYNKYNRDNRISASFRQMYSIYFMIPAYFKGLRIKKEVAHFQNAGVDPVRRIQDSEKGAALN